jgi:uncharacterized protein
MVALLSRVIIQNLTTSWRCTKTQDFFPVTHISLPVAQGMILFFLFTFFLPLICGENTSFQSLEEDLKWYQNKVNSHETGIFPTTKIHVLRLKPNEDLLESIWAYARVTNIKAASILSGVGSLTQTNIRYANQEESTSLVGHFEIVSLIGNIDYQKVQYSGSGHIHISVSTENGQTIGGHLASGNLVYTTVELTILEIQNAVFDRVLDETEEGGSGYYELKVFNDTVV